MHQTGTIYIIKNTVNDKVYIGQTTLTVRERFMQHMRPSKTKQHYKFYNAVRKYGRDKFYIEVLEDNIPIAELDKKEIAYIKEYDSCNNGYNTSYGGNVKRIHEPRDIENIITLFKEGKTAEEIGKIYGVHSGTIFRTIHAHGFYVHKNLYMDSINEAANAETLQKLVNQGFSNQEIADILGSKRWTVERRLHKYGIRRKRIYICNRPDFDWNGIAKDIHNNMPLIDICQKYDICQQTLHRIIEKLNDTESS